MGAMMGWIGWALFAFSVVWFVASMWYSHTKRTHLRNYIVYLFLSDEIRDDHKAKFEDWVRTTDANDAMALALRAAASIEIMATELSTTSTLAADAMIWKVRGAGRS